MTRIMALLLCWIFAGSYAAAEEQQTELVDNFMIGYTEDGEWDENLQSMAELFGIQDIPITSVSAPIITIQEDDYVIRLPRLPVMNGTRQSARIFKSRARAVLPDLGKHVKNTARILLLTNIINALCIIMI